MPESAQLATVAPPERRLPDANTKVRESSAARPRRMLGVAVVAFVMLLQLLTEVVAGRESARIWARMVFMMFELPLLMVTLSWLFEWSVRHRVSASRGLGAGIAIASAFGCVFGVLFGIVALHVPDLRLHYPYGSNPIPRSTLFGILNAQLYCGLWALAFVYPFAVEAAGARAFEARHLQVQTELARLRAHLEPHFLLNTLNAIAGLVTEEPREARRLLVCLGDLLRDAVSETSELQTLDKQVAWLRRYAQILEARHHGALHFKWDVPSDCAPVLLPRLLLQPLVENAVKHGALRRGDGAGEVTVRASRRNDGYLVCVIEDNGPGMPASDIRAGAFGLQSVRRRLELEVPRASLRLESSSEGMRSIVEIAPHGG